MPICPGCSQNFPLLDKHMCGRCTKFSTAPTQTDAVRVAIAVCSSAFTPRQPINYLCIGWTTMWSLWCHIPFFAKKNLWCLCSWVPSIFFFQLFLIGFAYSGTSEAQGMLLGCLRLPSKTFNDRVFRWRWDCPCFHQWTDRWSHEGSFSTSNKPTCTEFVASKGIWRQHENGSLAKTE